MTHGRDQVLTALVTVLTGLTTTGSAVTSELEYPHTTLPSLNVTAPEEDIDGDMKTRRLRVVVEARAKKTSSVRRTLDQIALEVEVAIAANPTLSGVALHIVPRRTSSELSVESEQPVGLMEIEFEALYRVDPASPDTLIN